MATLIVCLILQITCIVLSLVLGTLRFVQKQLLNMTVSGDERRTQRHRPEAPKQRGTRVTVLITR